MNRKERQWMTDTRRTIRLAIVAAEANRWAIVTSCAKSIKLDAERYHHDKIMETKDLISSLAAVSPSEFENNIAMRASAIRRLDEIKTLLGEALVATTDR